RAGTRTRFWCGDDDQDLKGNANIADASLKAKLDAKRNPLAKWYAAWDDKHPFTAPVGSFKANRWGLFDMHGNVWQWGSDWYKEDYKKDRKRDPKAPDFSFVELGPAGGERRVGGFRVTRGGAWYNIPSTCRAAQRGPLVPVYRGDGIGFRVVRVAPGTP